MGVVIAIDAGTTGVRSIAFDDTTCAVVAGAYRELTQHFPRPGWVEHDAAEIWSLVAATLAEVTAALDAAGHAVAAIGITNQRETVVAWDRRTGVPYARAIVWQDRRTASYCDALREAGHLEMVRRRTGLVLDPYFSGSKMAWLLSDGGVPTGDDLAFGTVDAWVCWNLTGGCIDETRSTAVNATDPSNASRTMVYDIVERRWSEELCELFGVPITSLPQVGPSSGIFGTTAAGTAGSLRPGIPVAGIAGDQAAALFGHACFDSGMSKNTYGTGSFVLMNVGGQCPPPADGVLTSVAWDLGGASGGVAYALECAIFVTGAAIQWLRDGLGIISDASEIGPLAAGVDSSEGVTVVPAFTGLGSPWWDPYARGTITGITRGSTRAHIARAVVESIAFQVRDALDVMAASAGRHVTDLRVDGGASVMDLLLQMQANQIQARVSRSAIADITALGAAWLSGLATGVWKDTGELAAMWSSDATFEPSVTQGSADAAHRMWLGAVDRSRGWAIT